MRRKIKFYIEGTYEVDFDTYDSVRDEVNTDDAKSIVDFDIEAPEFFEFVDFKATKAEFVE